jgi:hypothetical protein
MHITFLCILIDQPPKCVLCVEVKLHFQDIIFIHFEAKSVFFLKHFREMVNLDKYAQDKWFELS